MPGEPDPSRFSVHNTRIERVVRDGKRMVEKTIRPNDWLSCSLEEIVEEIEEYRRQLRGAGVRMPAVLGCRIEDECVVYLCEDGGDNLVERYETPEALVRDHASAVVAAVAVLRRAADAGVSIDPHVKNFVGEDGDLLYVDFSPPLVGSYVEARCAAAASAEEERILRENFRYFTPEFLPYHFAGDLLNVRRSAEGLFPELHAMLTEEGMLSGVSLEAFVERARSIRALEDLRLKERIYMF